jgi:lantibiotic biosynthesis protein
MLQLFPYTLYRIAGIKFDIWEKYSYENNLSNNYEDILSTNRNDLQKDILAENIQKTLPFSSIVFIESLEKFLQKNPKEFRKKERKTERTALKYLSRAASKTSPFGTFTTLQIVDNQKNTSNTEKESLSPNIKFLDFFSQLMVEDTTLRKHLPLVINPTLFEKENEVYFIQNHRNDETLQIIENDEIIHFLKTFFTEESEVTFEKLVTLLDDEMAENFILQMLQIGFLNWKMPFEKNNNGFLQLSKFLKKISPNELSRKILFGINQIFESKSIHIEELFLKEKWSEFALRTEENYYYDVASNHSDLPLLNEKNQAHYKRIAELYHKVQKVAYQLQFSDLDHKINQILNKNINSELSLTELYQLYFHGEQHKQNILQEWQEKYNLVQTYIKNNLSISNPNEIEIEEDWLALFADFVTLIFKKNDKKQTTSFNLVVQPYLENGQAKAILNGASIGFGKQFGRFLYLFDDVIRHDFFQKNKCHHLQLAELDDASFFNGNIHPTLLESTLTAPSIQYQNDKKINANELIIKKIDNEWNLWSKSENCVIIPLDMGIEHPGFRSPFFQLCQFFSYQIGNFRYLNDLINTQFSEKKLPRITVGKQLIIQRQTWYFACDELPILKKGQSEVSYFEEVLAWKIAQNLPNCVFVSIPFFQQNDESSLKFRSN